MANPTMDILDVVRKRLAEEETDFLQEALSAFLGALMEAEVNKQAGAVYGERSLERVSQRNGYRDRRWATSRNPARARGLIVERRIQIGLVAQSEPTQPGLGGVGRSSPYRVESR